MLQTFLVFLGGGLGAAARHGVNMVAARLLGTAFPYGTMIINVVGSVLMGLLAAWFAFRSDVGLTQHARLFLTTGILGGFTTFSTFSLDAVLLWERDAYLLFGMYVAGSVIVSTLGLFAGFAVVRALA